MKSGKKPDLVLGLATGSTPIGTYQELIRIHREEGLDFSKAVSFNLDEYYGITPDNPQSYNYYMFNNFFKHVNIENKNIHIPVMVWHQILKDAVKSTTRKSKKAAV